MWGNGGLEHRKVRHILEMVAFHFLVENTFSIFEMVLIQEEDPIVWNRSVKNRADNSTFTNPTMTPLQNKFLIM